QTRAAEAGHREIQCTGREEQRRIGLRRPQPLSSFVTTGTRQRIQSPPRAMRRGYFMAEAKIYIIGVGGDGLAGVTARARELLTSADLVLGSDPALGLLAELKAQRTRIGPDFQEAIQTLESNLGKKRMVVVASGDPLFYGVARYLCDRLGKDRFEVIPHVSTMQLAFARIKESWEEAYLTNLATHSLESVLDRIRTAEVVGLFTSEEDDPPQIARQLLARGLDYFRAYVCENLGGPDQRVTQGDLAEIAEMEFSPLNVMILKRKPGRPDQQRSATRFRR